MKSLNLIFLIILLSLVACKNNEAGQGNGTDTTAKNDSVKIEVDEQDQQANIPTGIVFDENRFPYLEPISDSTTLMHAFTVKMNLTHSFPLAPVTNDQLMWVDAHNSNETMGTFLSYVIEGRRIMLSGVNVRVDYFNKSVRGYSSVDSSFISSRSYFLLDQEKSQILKALHPVPTATAGKSVMAEEYYSVRGGQFTPKYVALGYLDYNDDYIVGFVLTATDEFEFKDALAPFYRLMGSFESVGS
jgi:hypothetical protein